MSRPDEHAAEREALFAEMWAIEDAADGGFFDAARAALVARIEARLDVIGRAPLAESEATPDAT